MTTDEEDPRVAKILELDKRRRAALVAADIPALDRVLADDLIHVHANGNVDTKMQYFSTVRTVWEFMVIERPEIAIRFHGAVAIMTGVMKYTVRMKATREIRIIDSFGTQIWAPHGDTWKQILYQETEIIPQRRI